MIRMLEGEKLRDHCWGTRTSGRVTDESPPVAVSVMGFIALVFIAERSLFPLIALCVEGTLKIIETRPTI